MYAAEDEYDGVAFFSPVMVQRRMLNPHYLSLDSCSAFNQLFTENYITDLERVRILLRAGCNAGTSTSDEKGMVLGAIMAWLVRTGIVNLASIPQMESNGWTFEYKSEGSWIGTSPNSVPIIFRRDMGICDRFPFVGLRDPEIRGAFAQIEANNQMAVVEHVMANVAENEDTSDDEYDGMDAYEYIDGLDADDYDTDTSRHMGTVSLINTIRKQFEGLTPREVKEAILARTDQSRIGNPTKKSTNIW